MILSAANAQASADDPGCFNVGSGKAYSVLVIGTDVLFTEPFGSCPPGSLIETRPILDRGGLFDRDGTIPSNQ